MIVDPKLKEFATARQREIIDAVNKHGSNRKAALALDVNARTIDRLVERVVAAAARRGYSPDHDMTHTAPPSFTTKGVSTLYDGDGVVRAQWVKTRADDQRTDEVMREAVEALFVKAPRVKPTAKPTTTHADLCNLYVITDYHVGMRSWKPETGADWDLEIAERVLTAAFTHVVRSAPKAAVGLVSQLGDFLHFDALAPMTPTSHHILDADGRYGHVVRVATRLLRTVIDAALAQHEIVYVLIAEGNHDPASSVWLRHLFGLLYENEPRVKMIESELPYYVHQHGETMLAFHHGHLAKNSQLPLIFAARCPTIWGSTTKRYCHTGHLHHVEEKEFAGMKTIQHATLAAADAYAARHGYMSEREISAITYHVKFGQVGRTTACPEMFE